MGDYYVRLACRDELPALGAIEVESTKRFVGTGLMDQLLDGCFDQVKLETLIDSGQVWVACSPGGTLVGFAVVSVRGSTAYLEELDVLPSHGRRGLGARLVEATREWALSKGFAALFLSTFEAVEWNAPFYERLGFCALPVEQWSNDFWQLREEEKALGLPVDKRVFMRLDLRLGLKSN